MIFFKKIYIKIIYNYLKKIYILKRKTKQAKMQNPFDPDKIYLKSKQTKPKFQATKIPTQIPNPPKQDYVLQK